MLRIGPLFGVIQYVSSLFQYIAAPPRRSKDCDDFSKPMQPSGRTFKKEEEYLPHLTDTVLIRVDFFGRQ